VGLERIHAFPLLDHDEAVRPVLGLKRQRRIGIDRGAVLDAALLARTAGTLARKSFSTSSRLPGLAVITAMTWIIS
jgi:hypothetical protein